MENKEYLKDLGELFQKVGDKLDEYEDVLTTTILRKN
ncbi:MAG: hypothetical protein Ct9H300mP28_06280 [Pseudomonadota bacterium]|nr:MAG: hypothetical protein Ct9H300mP28_06280 [Pseudomonadota bacterium]